MGELYDESSNMYFKQKGKKDMNEIYFLSGRKSTNGEYWWKHKLRKRLLRLECQIDPIGNLDIEMWTFLN